MNKSGNRKMYYLVNLLTLIISCSALPSIQGAGVTALTHNSSEKKVSVTIDGSIYMEYCYGNETKPIIYPIIGPYEIPMTRNFPMKEGVAGEATDHPHHQSMHFNHPINGKDFWHGKRGERIRNDEIVKAEVVKNEALIISRNSWIQGENTICKDTTEIRSGLTEGGRYIDYKVTVHASNGDITFDDTKEGTMSIRTHPALRLKGAVAKGSAINSEGITGKAIWGQIAKWVDYWGPIGDKTVGIAIFDHPDNPRHPTTWMAREYGMVNVNPFGKRFFKRGQGAMTVKNGESVTFAYRFFFHEGSNKEIDIPKHYKKWSETYIQGSTSAKAKTPKKKTGGRRSKEKPAILDLDTLPKVTGDGLKIDRYVQEPHIINPSALCFDKMGRLYVGAGPQYRQPKPDSPKDYIKIMIDSDHDGVVDDVKKFAQGFNSIQGMVWRDNELWVANSPDLTVLIDTDGDDVADIYRVVYRGLNTLRHGLHGLNWAPDGKLYMSYGNSRSGDHAPKAFRDLQGYSSKQPDLNPYNKDYTESTYKKGFRTLKTQETEGGIFRCDRKGKNLEIFSRGLRNPWDITFDNEFNWLGTDNDPGPQHDRIFMPIEHGHYTMRHPYKFDWNGKDPAIAPVSTVFPTVSGSGTGVIYNQTEYFGKEHVGHYFIADWTNKCLFSYKYKWEGAHQVLDGELEKVIDGGNTNGGDLGFGGGHGVSLFRPTDIEIGPAGDLYIGGWGSAYGTKYVSGANWSDKDNAKYEGRVFRLHNTKVPYSTKSWNLEKRKNPLSEWTFDEVMQDMGHHLPVWRTNAQDEIVRRGLKVKEKLTKELNSGKLSVAATTWSLWALAHIERENDGDYQNILAYANDSKVSLNIRVQAVRALGLFKVTAAQSLFVDLLNDKEPRVRHVALLGLQKVGFGEHTNAIFTSLADEKDRVCNYTAFQVMRRVLSIEEQRKHYEALTGNVKNIMTLALMEEGELNSKPKVESKLYFSLSETNWREKTTVTIKSSNQKGRSQRGLKIHYTLDGTTPKNTSPLYKKPFTVNKGGTLKAQVYKNVSAQSEVHSFKLNKISDSEWGNRLFAYGLKTKSKVEYTVQNQALQNGATVYSDRAYTYSSVPNELSGASIIQTANNDKKSTAEDFIRFAINIPAEVYIAFDKRAKAPSWLTSQFKKTDLMVKISEKSEYLIYKANFPAGNVTLGGAESRRSSMYHVFLKKVNDSKTNGSNIKDLITSANTKLGEEIFFGRGTCFACHKVGDKGIAIGPDLQGINTRRDVDYVIKSIVEPNAYIVEGYQQTVLSMKDGSQLFGMIQEETGLEIILYLPTGEKKTALVKNIVKREDNPTSGMPSSFIHTLSAKDIADVTAWIMALKAVGI